MEMKKRPQKKTKMGIKFLLKWINVTEFSMTGVLVLVLFQD